MTTFRGLATIRYHADDLAAARAWYTEVLGVEPYFERPEYLEFRLGDHLQEFGISRTPSAPAGVVAYRGGRMRGPAGLMPLAAQPTSRSRSSGDDADARGLDDFFDVVRMAADTLPAPQEAGVELGQLLRFSSVQYQGAGLGDGHREPKNEVPRPGEASGAGDGMRVF
ncbi:VOC family protein [Streptomyces sp. BP-8]|uniref:VOC family protein n=1 Tax=Streptomyces sirii TaxID=3127701 RepID=A0ABZ2QJQ8_9ACTN